MGKLKKYYLNVIVLFGLFQVINAQPNCEYLKSIGDSCSYKSCIIATAPIGGQGSQLSQVKLDHAIETCPSFAYPYKVKSIPYLKRGYFIEWKRLMDKAVELDPKEFLGYRGWCRYQFLKDYDGAIADFERLETLTKEIGYSANGHYHNTIAKAICYDALGKTTKAIGIIENKLSQEGYYAGPYDYLHLGMMYLSHDQANEAITALLNQLEEEPNADTHYYLAKAYQDINQLDKAKGHLELALDLYNKGQFRNDNYAEVDGRVYLPEIEQLSEEFAG